MNKQVVAVVGSFFGDEGKAKIVDHLSDKFDYVVRYQGGDNAGHSVLVGEQEFIFQLIPSGILKSNAVIAHGVVLNPVHLLHEIRELEKLVPVKNRLFVSRNVQVIFDWNVAFDNLLEKIRSSNGLTPIGTTGKGIGPTYSFKALRLGVRLIDLLDKDSLREKINLGLLLCNSLFQKYDFPTFDLEESVEKYYQLGQEIKPYMVNTFDLLQNSLKENKKILFEGSQGLLLDIDLGTYPFVTSSNIVGSLSSGTGLPFSAFEKSILGVVKAYATRIGNGSMPTEFSDETAEYIRKTANEYGSVTRRPRRIGWLDLVTLKYSFAFSGISEAALTLVDVLNGFKEVKVCVDYLDENGNSVPWRDDLLENVKPVYKSFKGWNDDYSKVKKFSDFSQELKDFVSFIEDFLKVKISIISFGRERNSTLDIQDGDK